MKFKARIFLDGNGRPAMAKEIEGNIWVHHLHADKKNWVTVKRIDIEKAPFITDNLSDKEQACYPPILS